MPVDSEPLLSCSYHLGPNGAILTSLNLFSTKYQGSRHLPQMFRGRRCRFDQVLSLLETRAPNLDYVVIDTPGQIEAFNWSASGSIITGGQRSFMHVHVCWKYLYLLCERIRLCHP
mmetsp:Transcript_42403/g.120241  ORF Transcript_42403/g.120241 Transcript_42403/m.120241 type:complete len:116 (-) Transcript_42403:765-1112(-)